MNIYIYIFIMPNPVVLLTLLDASGGDQYFYRAYSSEQEDRPLHKLRRDVLYHIGYQESYPQDRNTTEGHLNAINNCMCSVPLNQRDHAVRCVIEHDYSIHENYEPIEINDEYQHAVTDGNIIIVPHFYIQPNLHLDAIYTLEDTAIEEDSDSD
jgi:hypothetical protein